MLTSTEFPPQYTPMHHAFWLIVAIWVYYISDIYPPWITLPVRAGCCATVGFMAYKLIRDGVYMMIFWP